jgi:hypothetical protein
VRRTSRARALIALGLVLIVTAVVVWAVARSVVLRFPGTGFDLTEHDTGSVVLQASPATGAPQSGATLPLDLRRHRFGVGASNGHVVVQEDDTQTTGPLPPVLLNHQYVLDAGTAQNVADPRAFAYTPGNVVDRSSSYSVAFPAGTGTGPYRLWQDETGGAIRTTSAGTVQRDGLSLRRFTGTAPSTPVQPALLAQLGQQGLPSTLTVQQLAPQLAAAGIDTGAVEDAIGQLDGSADRTEARALFTAPVPMAFGLSTDGSLLVEPVSGIVVAVERVDRTLTMTPVVAQLGRLQLILGQSRYADKPVVATGAQALARLAANPPAVPYAKLTYSQDAASVAQAASYARSRAGHIQLWTRTVPLVLAAVGLVLVLVGLVIGPRRRHRRPRTADA